MAALLATLLTRTLGRVLLLLLLALAALLTTLLAGTLVRILLLLLALLVFPRVVLISHWSSPPYRPVSGVWQRNRQRAGLFPLLAAEPGGTAEVGGRLRRKGEAMAPRTFWKGYLKLSLVTCPVAMSPATTEGGRLRFHTLNRATGNRLVQQYVDAETGKPVAEEDEAKGYPRGEDDHVLLEDEEIEAVALESTRTIDIERFVPQGSIGWIWYDRPHFLVPNDKVGEEAFSVIREAMAETGMAGIARLVLYRRERAVLLRPRERGIVLWTLRYGDEVRPEAEYFARLEKAPVDKELLKLVEKLIDTRKADWSPGFVVDPVQDRLVEIIEAKRKGRKTQKRKAAAPQKPDNVVSIMDALRRSIAAEKDG